MCAMKMQLQLPWKCPPQTTRFSKFERQGRRKCTWYFCHTFLCNWFGEFYVYFDDEGCWSHPFPYKNKKQHDRKANSNCFMLCEFNTRKVQTAHSHSKMYRPSRCGMVGCEIRCGSSMAGSWVAAKDGLHNFKRRTNGLCSREACADGVPASTVSTRTEEDLLWR